MRFFLDKSMSLNLILDAWIPVVDAAGWRRVVAPWEITDPSVLRPDWPRADLNVACLEMLIGLVFMADPPQDLDDWEDREAPDPDRLKGRLACFAPAFNLVGEGPLFLQDLEPLEGPPNSPDMLFIDSAGANTSKNNADLMVHRDRYAALDLPLAAMALYAFQAFAPAGGAGNRTSMRGGGPLVTLVDPQEGLWPMVWANVPFGAPSAMTGLPWMRPTRVSDTHTDTFPPEGHAISVEAFFGMPRRLRLVTAEGRVTGVIQKPYGTKYARWRHPLSPYYRVKSGEEALPSHPKAGSFGYRHWLGILARSTDSNLAHRAVSVDGWEARSGKPVQVIVAGWAMDNMKARDFIYSVQPYVDLPPDRHLTLIGLIEAADKAAVALRSNLTQVLAGGESREAEREGFYRDTETAFLQRLADLKSGVAPPEVCATWLTNLRAEALRRFDVLALPGLDQRDTSDIAQIVAARRNLTGTFAGYGKYGMQIYQALMMELPVRKGKVA
jgi:CRISPR system Cascade subunit CasA